MILQGCEGFTREAHLRRDESFLAGIVSSGRARYLPVWRGMLLFGGESGFEPAFLSGDTLPGLDPEPLLPTFLGALHGEYYFSLALDAVEEEWGARLAGCGRFVDLRRALNHLNADWAHLLCYARALSHWRVHARFCGRCGAPAEAREAGHMLACTGQACATPIFPRTDPAVIVLVTNGDSCLLGRQAGWPATSMSSLAGFVEPGESLEEAVIREVEEEAGLRVARPTYFASQPWPFPASLMVGFFAEADSRDIVLKDAELESARWFTRRELADAVAEGSLRLPYGYSISHALVKDWFERGGEGALDAGQRR